MPEIRFFGRTIEVPERLYYTPSGGNHPLSLTYYQAEERSARADDGPITYLVGECFITPARLEDALSPARESTKGPSEHKGLALEQVESRMNDQTERFGGSYLIGYYWVNVTGRLDDEDQLETLAGVAANMVNKENAKKGKKGAKVKPPVQGKGKAPEEEDDDGGEGPSQALPELPLMYELHVRKDAGGQVHFEAVATAQIEAFLRTVLDLLGLAPDDVRVSITYEWASKDGKAKNACDACQAVAGRFFEVFGGVCNIIATEESKPKSKRWKCPSCNKDYLIKTKSGTCTDKVHKGKKPELVEV